MPPRPLLIFGSRPTCLFLSHYFYPLVEYFISGVSSCARKFLGRIFVSPFSSGAVGLPRSLRAPAFYFLYFPSHILHVCSFFHLIVSIFILDRFFPLGCSIGIPPSIFLSAFGCIYWFPLEPSGTILFGLWGFFPPLQFFTGIVRFFVP